jgi:hypothetical protein
VKTAIFLENQSIQPSNPVFSKLRTFALSCSVTPSAVAVGALAQLTHEHLTPISQQQSIFDLTHVGRAFL